MAKTILQVFHVSDSYQGTSFVGSYSNRLAIPSILEMTSSGIHQDKMAMVAGEKMLLKQFEKNYDLLQVVLFYCLFQGFNELY